MILSKLAIEKIKDIMSKQEPQPAALRIGVQGGGCSGFQYAMQFEMDATPGPMDKRLDFEGLAVLVDGTSRMYLEGASLDYYEDLTRSGFKFDNPNVKTTCGCGESFGV